MAQIEDTLPRRVSRMQKTMLEMDPKTDAATDTAFEKMFKKLKTYMPHDPATLQAVNALADDFDVWYVRRHLPRYPNFPPIPWDVCSSRELALLLQRFLWYKLNHERQSQESGNIDRRTLRCWSKHLLYLAEYNVLGTGGRRRQDKAHIVLGQTASGCDSLWTLVHKTFIPHLIREAKIPVRVGHRVFWGADELALVCAKIDEKIMSQSLRVFALIQAKSFEQFCLGIGAGGVSPTLDSFIYSGNEGAFLKQCDVVVWQWQLNVYDIELNLDYLQSFLQEHDVEFRPVIPACSIAGNVQLEFASTIIPLLVHRGALYALRKGKKHFFSSIDEFLSAKDSQFRGDGDQPLFRTEDCGGNLTDEALSSHLADQHLREAALETFLDSPHHNNWRRGVGDTVRAGFGADAQGAVLNLAAHQDVGRTHYSRGPAAYNATGAMMGEYKSLCNDVRMRLKERDITLRRRSTPAVRAVLRTHAAGGYVRETYAAKPEDVEHMLRQKPTYIKAVKRLDELQSVIDTEDPKTAEEIAKLVKYVNDQRHLVQGTLRTANKKRKRSEIDGTVTEGTVADTECARIALDALRSGPSLLLREQHVSLAAVIHGSWPRTSSSDRDSIHLELKPTSVSVGMFGEKPGGTFNDLQGEMRGGVDRRAPVLPDTLQLDTWHRKNNDSADNERERRELEEENEDEEDELPSFLVWSDKYDAGDTSQTVAWRQKLMKEHFRLLSSLDLRRQIENFVDIYGHCPFCPLHQAGFLSWQESHGVWRTSAQLGVGKTKIGDHLQMAHPVEFQQLCQGRPMSTMRSTFEPHRLNDADLQRVAEYMAGNGLPKACQESLDSGDPIIINASFTDAELEHYLEWQVAFDDWRTAHGGL